MLRVFYTLLIYDIDDYNTIINLEGNRMTKQPLDENEPNFDIEK